MEEFRKEPATLTLIIINIVVFLMVEFTGLSQDTLHMLDWGAAYTPLIVEKGEVYRLFTSMFLHFGIEHLINNMLVLFVLGSRLERVIGKLRFIVIYLAGGMTGCLLYTSSGYPSVFPGRIKPGRSERFCAGSR